MGNVTKRKKGQGGFSLVELAIAMGLIAIFIGGIMVWRSQISGANKLTELAQATTYMVSGIQRLYSGAYGSAAITGAVATSGVVNPPMAVSGSSITDELGNAVTITGATNQFVIQFSAPTAERCKDLAGMFLNSAPKVEIGTTVVKNTLNAAVAANVASMGTACAGTPPVAVKLSFQ